MHSTLMHVDAWLTEVGAVNLGVATGFLLFSEY